MKLLPLGLLLMAGVMACRQSTEPPVPIQLTLESSHVTARTGDTVTFIVNATGNNLVGVSVDYGDDVTDLYSTGGALTDLVTLKNAFSASGSFTVRAVVTDAIAGQKESSVGVVVN